jgi:hypothetical protein
MTSKHVADARRGERGTQLVTLSNNAEIAPAGILTSETNDEFNDLVVECIVRLGDVREPPVTSNEFAVPPQQRRRRDEERAPALTRKEFRE